MVVCSGVVCLVGMIRKGWHYHQAGNLQVLFKDSWKTTRQVKQISLIFMFGEFRWAFSWQECVVFHQLSCSGAALAFSCMMWINKAFAAPHDSSFLQKCESPSCAFRGELETLDYWGFSFADLFSKHPWLEFQEQHNEIESLIGFSSKSLNKWPFKSYFDFIQVW